MTHPEQKPKTKMRHCFNCGEELGAYSNYDPLDNCGATKCMREVRYVLEAERSDAHRKLDEDRGWS